MCSADAFASVNVTKEVILTWDFSHKRYIPLMLERGLEIPARLQYCLAGCQRIELAGRTTAAWLPDLDVLRATPVNLIIGIGETSAGQMCDRASRALAAALKLEPVLFPGGHGGFMENPAKFADRLREVID